MTEEKRARTRRMFFAIWPTAEIATQLGARVPDRVSPKRVIATVDLHVTLLFLGSIAEAQVAVAREAGQAQRVPPFDLRLDHLGQFARAQVLWIGPTITPEPLHALAGNLRAALRESIPLRDEREYRPHLTLARKTFLVPPPEGDCVGVDWPVREFVLAESRAKREQGEPKYAVVERWPLRA